MPLFIMFIRHEPENCPANNEKTRKTFMELMSKHEGLLKKHGIKNIGMWAIVGEHVDIGVDEAPSSEAYLEYVREPEFTAFTAFQKVEYKMAESAADIVKWLSHK